MYSAAEAAEHRENERELKRQRTKDLEEAKSSGVQHNDDAVTSTSDSDLSKELSASKAYASAYEKNPTVKVAVVHGLNRPLFHIDLTSALQSAIANVELRGEGAVAKGVGTEEN